MKSFLEVSVHFHPRRQKKKMPTCFSSRGVPSFQASHLSSCQGAQYISTSILASSCSENKINGLCTRKLLLL